MGCERRLASWLLAQRRSIERGLAARLGGALPAAGSPEAEGLRRFRAYALLALGQGAEAPPSLEGLRLPERRFARLLAAWIDTAAAAAGPDAAAVRSALVPLAERFRGALRLSTASRRASGAPRPGRRRVVSAAIDRVSDAFLAVDTATGAIVDANPAAGALIGVARDALLDADAFAFVPEEERETWWGHLDAVGEGAEPRRFRTRLRDPDGGTVTVEAAATRYATRQRLLALLMLRPLAQGRALPRDPGTHPSVQGPFGPAPPSWRTPLGTPSRE